jgi:autotransporter-associated beta strand protein
MIGMMVNGVAIYDLGDAFSFNQTNTGNLGYGGTISGAVNFLKAGTGGIILGNPNTFTGSFTVNGGTVFVQNDGTLSGVTSVDVNYGQLALQNNSYYEQNDRLPDNVDLNMRGGRFYITNKPNAANVERIGRLVLGRGAQQGEGPGRAEARDAPARRHEGRGRRAAALLRQRPMQEEQAAG